jgi:hypothetical protein
VQQAELVVPDVLHVAAREGVLAMHGEEPLVLAQQRRRLRQGRADRHQTGGIREHRVQKIKGFLGCEHALRR